MQEIEKILQELEQNLQALSTTYNNHFLKDKNKSRRVIVNKICSDCGKIKEVIKKYRNPKDSFGLLDLIKAFNETLPLSLTVPDVKSFLSRAACQLPSSNDVYIPIQKHDDDDDDDEKVVA